MRDYEFEAPLEPQAVTWREILIDAAIHAAGATALGVALLLAFYVAEKL